MFQINDIVLYNQTDVCRVEDIQEMPFLDSQRINYYVLKPVYEESPSNSKVYVPVSAGESRVCRAFSADELRQMLDSDGVAVPWIESSMLRKKEFTDILKRNHPRELIGLIRTICKRRNEKLRAGQKFSEMDEKMLSAAEKRLYPLFKYILDVDWNDFLPMIAGETARLPDASEA